MTAHSLNRSQIFFAMAANQASSSGVSTHRKVLLHSVSTLCREEGFQSASKLVLETLTEMLQSCKLLVLYPNKVLDISAVVPSIQENRPRPKIYFLSIVLDTKFLNGNINMVSKIYKCRIVSEKRFSFV